MVAEITKEQLEELKETHFCGTREEFHRLLEEYTGIEARPYTAYQYYDSADNYIGDSDNDDLTDLLRKAYINIKRG